MIDAMNSIGAKGWEFVQAYAVSNGHNGSVYHFVLKKKISKEKLDEIIAIPEQ